MEFVYDLIGYYLEIGVIEEGELPIIRFGAKQIQKCHNRLAHLTWLQSWFVSSWWVRTRAGVGRQQCGSPLMRG